MILPGSYANGFAPRDGQPLHPSLWKSCVFAGAPCLGPTGLTLRDWSGHGNHGTFTNMDAGTDWIASQGKYAIETDSVDDFVNIPHTPSLLIPHRFTLSVWVNPIAFGSFPMILCKGDVNSSYQLFLGSSVGTVFFRASGTSINLTSTTTAISLGLWSHIAGVYDGATLRIYINGKMEASAACTGVTATNTNPLRIGSANGGNRINALIDSLQIFDAPISENTVKILAMRRGIAHEMAPRRRTGVAGGFQAVWARRQLQIIGGGLN